MTQKKWNMAIEKYTEAIMLDPGRALFYANRAQAYLALKKYDECIADANRCLVLDRNYSKAYFRKGYAEE